VFHNRQIAGWIARGIGRENAIGAVAVRGAEGWLSQILE
jgi:hypothetical protein